MKERVDTLSQCISFTPKPQILAHTHTAHTMSATTQAPASTKKSFPYAPSSWDCLPEEKRAWLEELDPLVERFAWRLKRRELAGSTSTALQTTELLKTYLNKAPETLNMGEIANLIRQIGKVLTNARQNDLIVGNVVRRVLFILRHACAAYLRRQAEAQTSRPRSRSTSTTSGATSSGEALSGSPAQSPSALDIGSAFAGKTPQFKAESDGQSAVMSNVDMSVSLHNLYVSSAQWDDLVPYNPLKAHVIQDVSELAAEITQAKDAIADQASQHIFDEDVILTAGYSSAVLEFLVAGATLRSFTVFVLESAPSLVGQRMAAELARHKINVTLLTDAAMVAIMPSVTKILVGSHAVMADGGILAPSGYAALCLAAKRYAKPVVVLAGLHKVSPLYAFDQTTFNELTNPAQILSYDALSGDSDGLVEVLNPVFDYVAPESISLYVTNFGCYQPSYIYRLLSEYYNVNDYNL